MAIKYNTYTLKKTESILQETGYVIRYERGTFNSGFCILEDKKVVVINKFYDSEARINCLIDILSEVKIDESQIDDKLKDFYHELIQQNQPA